MNPKIRLDKYLVENKYFETREKAKRSIKAKYVLVNGKLPKKAGELFLESELKNIEITKDVCPYASRGGLKLKKAIEAFELNLEGITMLDVGASTGGFTDCALSYGAKEVHALDVGSGQLVDRLRNDERVVVYENVNFRNIAGDFFDTQFDLITMDVSFISAKLLLENIYKNLSDDGIFICLIKPQFEAGVDASRDKKGVISDKQIHLDVINKFVIDCSDESLYVNKIIYSPIKGGSGNVEFLAYITKNDKTIIRDDSINKLLFKRSNR